MIKGCLKRFGLWPVLAGVTIISIVASVAITVLASPRLGRADAAAQRGRSASCCPLVLAPTMSLGSFSLLIKLDHAHEQLRLISNIDDLTGAYNRRYFMDRLRAEVERSARSGFSFSLALIDIDNFKAVNDQHGHLAGDEVLRRLAQTCMAQVRATRHLRALRRRGVRRAAAADRHRRMRCNGSSGCALHVAQLRVELARRERSASTVSIGLATTGKPAAIAAVAEIDAVLRVADEALYRAKRAGKNQVAGPLGVAA